jgi:HEAT repeat protein
MIWWTLQQLKAKDPATRLRAIARLSDDEDPSVAGSLLPLIADSNPAVQAATMKVLGKFKEEQAVPALLHALHARDAEVRESAADALKQIGDARAIPPLVVALKDDNNGVRWRAANALESLGWRPENEDQEALQLVALGKLEKAVVYGAAAVEPLILVLKGGVYYKRMQAVEALSKISDPRVVRPLVGALRDEDNHVRASAVEALARVGDARAVEPLVAALHDKDNRVRANAVEALSKLGDARAIDPLAKLLTDACWDVRMASVEALGKFKDPRVAEPLMLCLKDKDRDTRQAAVMSLGKIGGPGAVEALVVALIDEHEAVRQSAGAMLKRVDANWVESEGAKRAVPTLRQSLQAKEYWVRQAANDVLAKIGDDQATQAGTELATFDDPMHIKRQLTAEALAQGLADPDRDLRQACAEALGRGGDPKVVPLLVKALDDSDEWVRKATAEALTTLNWQPTDEKQRARQMVILQQWEGATALGKAAIEPLIEALHIKTSSIRSAAAKALGKIGDARAVEPLAALLGDKYATVRRAAAEALETLRWQPKDTSLRARHGVEMRHWDKVVELGPFAVDALIAAIKEKSDDPDLAAQAETALTRITDPRAAAGLMAHTKDPEVTRPIVNGLEQILAFKAEEMDETHLRAIAGLTTLMESRLDYDEATGIYTPALEEIDCGLISQLAQQELARRETAGVTT